MGINQSIKRIRVLVVDDSTFFLRRMTAIIAEFPDLELIDTAKNGKEAIEKAIALKPDVITMDVEMPVMDGVTAVREIMSQAPVPILMFSSVTKEGAKQTLDSLDAGALDYLPKHFAELSSNNPEVINELISRIRLLSTKRLMARHKGRLVQQGQSAVLAPVLRPATVARPPMTPRITGNEPVAASIGRASGKKYQLVAIGSSTGGPVALQRVLTSLAADFPLPIVLVQHMPKEFTPAFAERLNTLCKINVKEAATGDVLKPGWAYLAPGGTQMVVEGRAAAARLKVIPGPADANYKPCVDITFTSLTEIYGGNVLAVILTGMGADGREGGRLLKAKGSVIWAQDEATSVVYGMPQAVTVAGVATESIPLDKIGGRLTAETSHSKTI